MAGKQHGSRDLKRPRVITQAEFVAKLSLLGATNREAYRALRDVMWSFVVDNSARSDFPSNFS